MGYLRSQKHGCHKFAKILILIGFYYISNCHLQFCHSCKFLYLINGVIMQPCPASYTFSLTAHQNLAHES